MTSINRGDVWLVKLDPTLGAEIKKTRPVLVISNNDNNSYNNIVTVLPITSNVVRVFDFEIFLPQGEANLPKDSKVKADQIRSVDKMRFIKLIGHLSASFQKDVDAAIKLHLAL